jgi:tripartite-type tricarboxylate transporter receptor subunit TctC
MALFSKAAGVQLRHLPTNGGGPAVTAMLGNNAQVSVVTTAAASSQVRAGKIRALASLGGKRSKLMPDVPTLKELGYGVEYYLWVGIFAPKGTPEAAINVLRGAIDKVAHTEKYQTTLSHISLELAYLDAPEFAKFWAADAKHVIDAVHIIGRAQG